jgi:hypothetical protein
VAVGLKTATPAKPASPLIFGIASDAEAARRWPLAIGVAVGLKTATPQRPAAGFQTG